MRDCPNAALLLSKALFGFCNNPWEMTRITGVIAKNAENGSFSCNNPDVLLYFQGIIAKECGRSIFSLYCIVSIYWGST